MQYRLRLISLLMCLLLYGSARRYAVDPIIPHPIEIIAERLDSPQMTLAPELRYIDGWSLSSSDKDFGGFSAVMVEGGHFVAVSDIGAIISFSIDSRGQFGAGHIAPLPRGCGHDIDKTQRDSESLTFDRVNGARWIGLEWRNAICRSDNAMKVAQRVARPVAMQHWPKTGGPEAMVHLADGRFLAFAERSDDEDESALPPMLVYDRDPTLPGARGTTLAYQPPEHHFSPTDAAELPGGRLLMLNRRYEPPINFSARLSVVDPVAANPTGAISGRVIAHFGKASPHSNYEGLATSNEGGRTFVWIISDDNYMWLQRTYLLKFELLLKP